MNGDGGLLVQFLLALGAVLFLIVVIAWLLKKVNLVSSRVGRLGEDARLSVSEAVAVDHRRKLVLVKRDHVEHLILIGGENDLLLEHAIPPHARPQPKTSPQSAQQGQQVQSRPHPEEAKNNTSKATKAPEVKPQTASKSMAAASGAASSKSSPSSNAEKRATPISSALSALSSKANKGEKAAKQPNKPEHPKSSGPSMAEASKTQLRPQATAGPAQPPTREQKSASQEAQPDIMANWRPARPQARPTPGSAQDSPAQKPDTPQAPKGPVMPPLAPAQAAPPQQVPVQPEASAPQPSQAQQPAQPIERKDEKPDEGASNSKTDGKPEQKKPDDQQTMETNYQDEITRLLDELSNDSSKS